MFTRFRRAKSLITTDIHSHLIPSVDDGSKSLNESLQLIEELYKFGYRRVVTTPHVSDMFKNSRETILKGYDTLREELNREKIDIEMEIGAEYYIDEHFMELLESEKLLSFGDKNYLLFEFSYFRPPQDIEELVYDITLKGYTPILAHPERYIYWHGNISKYKELKDMGVLFQLNLNSLNGYYSLDVRECAERLIKASYIDFLGTDTHHLKHIENLRRVFALSLYKKIFKYNTILNEGYQN